jgi:hypothetical protein
MVKAGRVQRVPLNDAHCIKKVQAWISLVWIGFFELDCLACRRAHAIYRIALKVEKKAIGND